MAKKRNQKESKAHSLAARLEFSGPLPPPNILTQYDQIVPGAAERIISMAENQAKQRQNLEKVIITTETGNSKIGMFLGFIIIITVVIIGFWLALNNKETTGIIAIIAAVSTPVIVLWKRQKNPKVKSKKS